MRVNVSNVIISFNMPLIFEITCSLRTCLRQCSWYHNERIVIFQKLQFFREKEEKRKASGAKLEAGVRTALDDEDAWEAEHAAFTAPTSRSTVG